MPTDGERYMAICPSVTLELMFRWIKQTSVLTVFTVLKVLLLIVIKHVFYSLSMSQMADLIQHDTNLMS